MGTIEHKTFPKGILLMQFAITLLTGILLPCNMKAQKYEGWRQNGNYGMKAEGSEEWCVPPMYEQTWGHNKAESPIFLVKRGEYYGFIDEDNNTVLPFVYTDATCFFNRLATVQNADDSLYYAIDLKGKVVSKGYKNLSGGIGIFFRRRYRRQALPVRQSLAAAQQQSLRKVGVPNCARRKCHLPVFPCKGQRAVGHCRRHGRRNTSVCV